MESGSNCKIMAATLNNCKIAIVIPALDPDQRLLDLHKALSAADQLQIIVVNDGSSQASAGIFRQLAARTNTYVIHHAKNLGKGAALKSAFHKLLELYAGNQEFIGSVTCDCDGQHSAEDVLKIVEQFTRQPQTLLLGSRTLNNSNVPWKSRLGNAFIRYILKKKHRLDLRDTQTGLRAIPRNLMQKSLQLADCGYEFETRMLLLAKDHNIPIGEITIATLYYEHNRQSHFRGIADSWRILQTVRKKRF